MKKTFLIVSAIILAAVVSTIITLACITKKYDFDYYSNASSIVVYDSTSNGVGKQHGGEDTFDKDSSVFKQIMNLLNESMGSSLLTLLVRGANTNPVVEQDLSGTSPTFSPTTRQTNYCIEISFSAPISNQIVYYKGNTKYLNSPDGYQGLMFVLGTQKQFGEINVYYKATASDSYQSNPVKLTIDNSKLVDYIDKM